LLSTFTRDTFDSPSKLKYNLFRRRWQMSSRIQKMPADSEHGSCVSRMAQGFSPLVRYAPVRTAENQHSRQNHSRLDPGKIHSHHNCSVSDVADTLISGRNASEVRNIPQPRLMPYRRPGERDLQDLMTLRRFGGTLSVSIVAEATDWRGRSFHRSVPSA